MRPTLKTVTTALAASLLALGCESNAVVEESEWVPLFGGRDLVGWETYVGPALDEDRQKIPGSALGPNNDVIGLVTVVEEDGEPAIRVSGERGGGFNTVAEYGNYHLRLEYKWGTETPWPWMSRRDSGLLYHAWDEHGIDDDDWMRSHEMQIMQTRTAEVRINGGLNPPGCTSSSRTPNGPTRRHWMPVRRP